MTISNLYNIIIDINNIYLQNRLQRIYSSNDNLGLKIDYENAKTKNIPESIYHMHETKEIPSLQYIEDILTEDDS